jgi:flagellin
MEVSMERLASGKRINGAADDAAGLAIASRMTAQINALKMNVKNANDGISLGQTMEGALIEVEAMAQRMRELTVQASNGSNAADDLSYIQDEITVLQTEIERVIDDTKFNGYAIWTAGVATDPEGNATADAYTIFLDQDLTAASHVNVTTADFSFTDLAAVDVTDFTNDAAVNQLADIDTFLDSVRAARSDLGAAMNVLGHAINNMSETIVNTEAARSRIVDADFATETASLSRAQILQQAGTAMLAQANAAPQSVLALLQ